MANAGPVGNVLGLFQGRVLIFLTPEYQRFPVLYYRCPHPSFRWQARCFR